MGHVLKHIEQQGQAAARTYSDVNDACPYPFTSEEGKVFKQAFLDERAWLTKYTPVCVPPVDSKAAA